MARYRNLGSVPLDMPDGRQLFVGDDVELSDVDLKHAGVTTHVQQGTLAPVTLAQTAAPAGKAGS